MADSDDTPQRPAGIPRWLVYGMAAKLVLALAITLAVVWYASR